MRTQRAKPVPIAMRGIAGVWAGVVLGGSLIAAPAKFQAPNLTREVALEVGRAQFAWLGVAEWALLLALTVTVLSCPRTEKLLAGAAGLLFLSQRFLLMPPLDERTVEIINGANLEPSPLHIAYIGVELTKVAALLALALLPRR